MQTTQKFRLIHSILFPLMVISTSLWAHQPVYDIKDFGAVGDGQTDNTAAIQEAIDTCTKKGGGSVLVPAGFPLTKAAIESAGFQTIGVDVSEFRKLDGGLSCLSLRF